MDKEVVKELIQNELNTKNLASELQLLNSGKKREEMLIAFESLKAKLGGTGASKNTASLMLKTLSWA